MFDLFKMADGAVNKKLLLGMGITTAALIMVYYYHQIKLSKLQIEETKKKLGKA